MMVKTYPFSAGAYKKKGDAQARVRQMNLAYPERHYRVVRSGDPNYPWAVKGTRRRKHRRLQAVRSRLHGVLAPRIKRAQTKTKRTIRKKLGIRSSLRRSRRRRR